MAPSNSKFQISRIPATTERAVALFILSVGAKGWLSLKVNSSTLETIISNFRRRPGLRSPSEIFSYRSNTRRIDLPRRCLNFRYQGLRFMKKPPVARSRANGYTLMEIMLVVAIIAVIAGGVIVKMTGALDVAKIQRAEQDINNIYSALKLYEARNYQMPDQSQGLEALVTPPTTGTKPANWLKLMDSVPTDPWNTPYQYRNPGKRDPSGIDVFSFGPDRKEGPNNIYRRVN